MQPLANVLSYGHFHLGLHHRSHPFSASATLASSNKTETLQALQRLNNLACKMITPVRRTTPRKSLEVIYDILPLDLQGQLEAISAQKRNARILTLKWSGHNPGKKTYIGHRYHWSTVILTLNADNNQTSDRIKETNPPQRYTVYTCLLYTSPSPRD